MPRRITHVADALYGYVEVSPIERKVLDHPVSQRLRRVSQNGLAHLVYPEVRTSRLSHSLGTMHLSSRLLGSCLKNTDPETRTLLEQGFIALAEQVTQEVESLEHVVGTVEPAAMFHAYRFCDQSLAERLQFIEQALRLAALFHDLGHLPFSHDFEYAVMDHHDSPRHEFELKGYRRGGAPLHEQLGHQLARLVFVEISNQPGNSPDPALKALFDAAYMILEAPSIGLIELDFLGGSDTMGSSNLVNTTLAWLHALIDGEVDADRCDYLRRDSRSYGLSFSDYDLDRLLANLSVGVHRGAFKTVIQGTGLSALESFLLGRMRLYEHGIFHHKVVQVGQALRHCTRLMLDSPNKGVDDFLSDVQHILDSARMEVIEGGKPEVLRRFSLYDDAWWTIQMREFADSSVSATDSWWFNLVLERSSGPISLWKRRTDPPWNSSPPADFNVKARSIVGKPPSEAALARWNEAVEEFRSNGVLVTNTPLRPWEPDALDDGYDARDLGTYRTSLLLEDNRSDERTLTKASDLSPLIARLWDIWDENLQLYAFRTLATELDGTTVVETLKRAIEERDSQ